MAYVAPQPPNIDGTCSFITNDPICMAVQAKLDSIRSSFQPSVGQQAVDTFYITATYNRTVAGTKIGTTTDTYPVVNGDTVDHCLALFDAPTGM